MTFKKRQQINTTCTICSNEVEMVIKNNVWIYVRWKKEKKRNEYSLATVYNPQWKLIHTHTHIQETARVRERQTGRERGERREGGRGEERDGEKNGWGVGVKEREILGGEF